MKRKPIKLVPGLIALGVISVVCLLRCLEPEILERQEWVTYDLRVRFAQRFSPSVVTNFGFVAIDEESVRRVRDGSVGLHFGLLWPRQVYGRLVDELAAQGAKAVAFDVVFGELRNDHPSVLLANGQTMPSDEFFALQMRRASNVVMALTEDVTLPSLFLTNAYALGDISTSKDPDGTIRRARAFRIYRRWHSAFRQLEADPEYGVDLSLARVEPRQLVLPRTGADDIKIPLDAEGKFDLADFGGDKLPAGAARRAKPFTEERVWHMGVVLAAMQLQLDLAKAEIDLPHGRVTLRGPGNIVRVIPVDADGAFYIDWCMTARHPRLTVEPIQALLAQYKQRLDGQTNQLVNHWRGKLAVVGSSAVVGNNLMDRGATPLLADTLLVSKHWNVANSIITGRFVQRTSLAGELLLILLLGAAAGWASWRLGALPAFFVTIGACLGYVVLAFALYVQTRHWLPIFLPVVGGLLVNYVCQTIWRVVFEQAERRRLRSIFSTIVSPKIVNELLKAETLALGGARREITVLFADVRGFTQFTDASQDQVAELVRKQNLSGAEAEACFDEQARQTLKTINRYLGLVAETIINEDGTLDKFIGDCVMAFWGAPTPNPKHALACVRAAIDAQRAIYELNRHRETENLQIEAENLQRTAVGLDPQPLQPILFLGTGINTGVATVGLMGSEAETGVQQGSYTVFGREVNLASRLEGASGRGHIFISQTTYEHLRRDEPTLAATCVQLAPITVKGIRTAVPVYEVPWRLQGAPPLAAELAPKTPDTTAFVSIS